MIGRAAAILALALAAGTAQAATQVVTTTLHLGKAHFTPGNSFQVALAGPAYTPVAPLTFGVGDTLDFTIDFLGTQHLTLFGFDAIPDGLANYISALLIGTGFASQDYFQTTGQLSLLDKEGVAFITSPSRTYVQQRNFRGELLPADFPGGPPQPLDFYGLRLVGTLDSFGAPQYTTAIVDRPHLIFASQDFSTNGAVPEPESWALMIAGFALTGAALRRLRHAAT